MNRTCYSCRVLALQPYSLHTSAFRETRIHSCVHHKTDAYHLYFVGRDLLVRLLADRDDVQSFDLAVSTPNAALGSVDVVIYNAWASTRRCEYYDKCEKLGYNHGKGTQYSFFPSNLHSEVRFNTMRFQISGSHILRASQKRAHSFAVLKRTKLITLLSTPRGFFHSGCLVYSYQAGYSTGFRCEWFWIGENVLVWFIPAVSKTFGLSPP